jgi:hypothetical protein
MAALTDTCARVINMAESHRASVIRLDEPVCQPEFEPS